MAMTVTHDEKTYDLEPGGRLLAWDPCLFFQPSVPCHHSKPEEKHGTHIFDKENCSYRHLLVITGYKWDYTFHKWGYKYL